MSLFGMIASTLLGGVGAYQQQRKYGEAQDRMSNAADRAAREGKYKPFGVTSGAGSASFKDGNASYSMDPRYQAQQDQMFGLGTDALNRAGGNYDDMASDMYNRQRNLGADSRLAEATQLGNRMFGAGTQGLRVGGEALGGSADSGMMSPDGYGFARAYEQQKSMDRSNAFEQAQRQREREIAIGQGMFSQGQGMDANAMAMIGLGGDLGSQQSAANNAAMNNYLSGQSAAAGYTKMRGDSQAGGLMGLGNGLNSMMSGGDEGPISRGGSSNPYSFGRVNNSYSPYSMMPSSRNISDYRNASFGEAGRMSPQGTIGGLGTWSGGGTTAATTTPQQRYSNEADEYNFYNRRR